MSTSVVDINQQPEKTNKDEMDNLNITYFGRLCQEFSFTSNDTKGSTSSMFSIQEPNGEFIDVKTTFLTSPKSIVIPFRLVSFLGTLAYFNWVWFFLFPPENRFVFIAFLTKWAIVLTMVYQFLACIMSIWPNKFLEQPTTTNPVPRKLLRTTWILSSALLPVHLIVVIFYWIAVRPEEANQIEAFMDHAIIFALLVFDAQILHRFPIRAKHILLMYALFGIWYIFYIFYDLYSGAGNGEWDWEPEGDQSSLYLELNWKTRAPMMIAAFFIFSFLLIPGSFMIFWTVSVWSWPCKFDGSHRMIIDENEKTEEDTIKDKSSQTDVVDKMRIDEV